jgi:hypothetical protein
MVVSAESTRNEGGNALVWVGVYAWSGRQREWLEAGRWCCWRGLVKERCPLEKGVLSTEKE